MTAVTAAQARALRRLDGGAVVYAYDGVSRATAYALVRRELAEWAVDPHAVSQRAPTPGSRIRYQLEWGLRAVTITWHLHPTVWQHAVLGRHEALIWAAEDDVVDWAVYPLGGALDPAAGGTSTGEADAKTQAEAALRRLAAGDPARQAEIRITRGPAHLRGQNYQGRSPDSIARRLFGRSAQARPSADPNNRGQGMITRTDRHGTHVLADYTEH